ncbi:MAG TPA: phosphoenolpyruvate--protein phosphotransferase [Candidatus Limnocylindria bacterium]|nr:phosphoenolpyruvate--protein phosphotransferase [Candidatus Limnocylindria bacterium]
MARAILSGRPGSPGIGEGRLIRVPEAVRDGATPVAGAARGQDSHGDEVARLRHALDLAAGQLEALATETAQRAGDEIGAIFEAQALFARDPALIDPALEAIRDGRRAVEAIELAAADQADRLAAVDDAYFQERAADIRDVARRVVGILEGRPQPDLHHRDGTPAILVADDLDASVVATLRPELVSGIALAGGAPNGHLAIVARALGVPVVLGLGGAVTTGIEGEAAVVDGTGGRLLLDPSPADVAELRVGRPTGVSTAPTAAPGGGNAGASGSTAELPVEIEANVGSVREAEEAAQAGAAGIGLVRTELLFLGRSTPPGEREQASVYRRILATMEGRPVVFRTLDIGGDKPAAYQASETEANPALGIRGLRLGLRHHELLETQLAALVEAAAGGTLRVLFPMVAVPEELEAAREVLDRVIARARERGSAPATVLVGIMVEVPSAAIGADLFAPLVDFYSIGTNDLVQYTLAVDRLNPALADLATPYQPALLRLIAQVTEAARGARRPVAVCGEAAADPLLAALLVGLGVTELSVAPGAIAPLRQGLAGLDVDRCRELARAALDAHSAAQVRRIAGQLGTPDPAGGAGVDLR